MSALSINKRLVWRTLDGMTREQKVMVAVLVSQNATESAEIVRVIFDRILTDAGQPSSAPPRPRFLRHLFGGLRVGP